MVELENFPFSPPPEPRRWAPQPCSASTIERQAARGRSRTGVSGRGHSQAVGQRQAPFSAAGAPPPSHKLPDRHVNGRQSSCSSLGASLTRIHAWRRQLSRRTCAMTPHHATARQHGANRITYTTSFCAMSSVIISAAFWHLI